MNTTRHISYPFLLCVLFALLGNATAYADIASPTVTEIGDFGGGTSQAIDVTDDGNVVGSATIGGGNFRAYLWTKTGGLVDLGTLGGSQAIALAISDNNLDVVGNSDITGNSTSHAFLWTQANGMTDLGTLGGSHSYAYAISVDGGVVAGSADTATNTHAFRWTQAGGMIDLGTLGGNLSSAKAISADGGVVAGNADTATNIHAFRWTQAGGMIDLGTLGGNLSSAEAISSDGSVVAGSADTASNMHAFRWTQAGGMVDLGSLASNYISSANAMSANGSIIVGQADVLGNVTYHAFRWTQTGGMQDLNTLLGNAGVNMSGITLTAALGISPSGNYIVGYGVFPDSANEGFLACYNPNSGCVGVTTNSSLREAAQNLSEDQRGSQIESRSSVNELLGMTRPFTADNYAYTGAMFGSALGYVGEQVSAHGMTFIGGVSYGAQDYSNIKQDNSVTLALATRYTFDDPFNDEGNSLHPFVELGGWITPEESLSFTRVYANGSGTSSGIGSTDAMGWGEYGRLGLAVDLDADNKIIGYAELGQQYMSFNSYNEDATSNPFPASVNGGVLRLDILRAGGSWTHKFDDLEVDNNTNVPISFTLACAIANAFHEHAGLRVDVSGSGSSAATNNNDTWAEYGVRLEGQVTQNVGLDLDLNGTTGGDALGTAIHGGVGLTYKF